MRKTNLNFSRIRHLGTHKWNLDWKNTQKNTIYCSFVIYFQLCSSPPWESPHQHVANFTLPKPPSAGFWLVINAWHYLYKYIYKYINIVNTYPVTVLVRDHEFLVVRIHVLNLFICVQKQATMFFLRVINWSIDLLILYLGTSVILQYLFACVVLGYLCTYGTISSFNGMFKTIFIMG